MPIARLNCSLVRAAASSYTYMPWLRAHKAYDEEAIVGYCTHGFARSLRLKSEPLDPAGSYNGAASEPMTCTYRLGELLPNDTIR